MANFFLNDYSSSGLNDISYLDLPSGSLHSSNTLRLPSPLSLHSKSTTYSNMTDSSKAKAAAGGFGSRIPKINFGFRKQTKNGTTVANNSKNSTTTTNGDSSERSTPEGCEGSPPPLRAPITRSAPNSNNSSPTVGRSKSLRLPRSNYTKYSSRTNQLNDDIRDESEDFYPDDLVVNSSDAASDQQSRHQPSKTGLVKSGGIRPRSSTISAGANLRSRSISPGGLIMSVSSSSSGGSTTNGAREMDRNKFGFYGYSLSQSDVNDSADVLSQESNLPPSFSRRSQSFSAKHHARVRAGVHNRLQPPQAGVGANQPYRRSKTPTALSQRTSQIGQASTKNGTSKLALTRTSSLGKFKQQSTATSAHGGNGDGASSQLATQSRSSQLPRNSSGELRGKRPSSIVIADGAADLNMIAQELSQGDADQPEVKSVAGRMRPSSAKTLSASSINTGRSHSSIGYSKTATYEGRSDTPEQGVGPSGGGGGMGGASSSTKSKLLSVAGRLGSSDKQNRPTSARDYYHHSRKGSDMQVNNSDMILDAPLERSHSEANFDTDGDVIGSLRTHVRRQSSGGGGRSSAPSSGRSTPVHRSLSGPRGGKDVPDGGVVSSLNKAGAGLPPRTPYSKGTRTKGTPTSTPAGINELEGSVLLEADDYRRISNEVKSLKTMLLKLKRELQVDSEGKSPSSQSPQTPALRNTAATPVRVGRSATTPSATPGPAHTDLRKKLKAVTTERDKALDEVGNCKKELKTKSDKIESLTAELEKERKKNTELSGELEKVEAHRSRLLDKVERLHADKHNLEARLNTLERATLYEQTISESWLDELDGDCDDLDIMDPELGTVGETKDRTKITRKEMTESEIGDSILSDGGEGESSEPESAAVCSVPIS